MKKNLLFCIITALSLVGLSACNKAPEEVMIPTTIPTVTITPTAIPTPTEIPHEHTWEAKSAEATCTTNGSTWSECTCGATKDVVEIFATGHTTTINTIKEPTFEEDGLWEEVCSECHEVVNTGSMAHEHIWEEKSKEATCAEAGSTWIECVCGEKKDIVELPTIEHIAYEKVITKEPTVTEEGLYEMRCTACGKVGDTGTIEKSKPTPTPKPTNTPKPTATPKPTKAPEPTKVPLDNYTWIDCGGYYIYNRCVDKGVEVNVNVYDYPSKNSKVIHTLVPINSYVLALERCVETGWYKVQIPNNAKEIGYVDDEYMRSVSIDFVNFPISEYTTAERQQYIDFTQFEPPYLGTEPKLKELGTVTIHPSTKKYSLSIFQAAPYLYCKMYPDCSGPNQYRILIAAIADTSIAEITADYYNESIGYYSFLAAYRSYGIDVSPKKKGATTITVTEYEISNYSENGGNPTFTLGKAVNTMTFPLVIDGTSHTQTEYDPVSDGYPELYCEWQVGEKAYAQVWGGEFVNGNNYKGQAIETSVLVIYGEGTLYEEYRRDEHLLFPMVKYNCPKVSKIYVCEGITEMAYLGVEVEDYLDELHFPSTLKSIGAKYNNFTKEDDFFKRVTSVRGVQNEKLKELILPEGLEFIGHNAFSGFEAVEKIVLPSTLKYIDESAFSRCFALKEITIPASVEYIGGNAFQHAKSLLVYISRKANTKDWYKKVGAMKYYWNDYADITIKYYD